MFQARALASYTQLIPAELTDTYEKHPRSGAAEVPNNRTVFHQVFENVQH